MRFVAWATTVLLLLTGCSAVTAPVEEPTRVMPRITMSPVAGAAAARPDKGLVVKAHDGTLTALAAYAGGTAVPGTFNASRTVWRSDWTLAPDTEYVVNAIASATVGGAPGGGTAQLMGRFRTLRPQRPIDVLSITPNEHETVGVGMPIIVMFTQPVQDRRAVERALEVRATPIATPAAYGQHDTKAYTKAYTGPVDGAWHWFSDSQVVFRTRKLWPARQNVVLTAHLSGVRSAPGTYGTADRTVSFAVGRRMVSTVDTRTHQMVVRRDGEVAQRMAISAGMATTREYTTTSGVHLTMEKGDPVRMISPGRHKGDPGYYNVMIGHAVRISNSGEYVHAKNNVWAQGRANVSHGCVNARPDQAAWFYDSALRGDPVVVTGTDRALEWNNGWGYWQLPWDAWIKGSALRAPEPVRAFVSLIPTLKS
ncbi:Ig-like domain-containing protein [Microtetraspora sp. NBRC 16547]|uniref:L,D-transpeptidase n=1 Tax=Microtetraspora sp. NBRC 16547 TaxID=3030993 RepID=UPI00249FA9D7|nr:Ig-like domain-containing protein [Microtetraspora sp. NBRC 16547]GLW97488.1 lipoprotein [Microtetraspora sp. NBRC 16547]